LKKTTAYGGGWRGFGPWKVIYGRKKGQVASNEKELKNS